MYHCLRHNSVANEAIILKYEKQFVWITETFRSEFRMIYKIGDYSMYTVCGGYIDTMR